MNEIKLTHTERIIMEVVWGKGEMSNSEIHDLIGEKHEWSRHMVKLYTKGLADKGLLGINQISERKMKYYPLVTKDEYLAFTANKFLRNNYRKLSNMVVGLIDNEMISSEEIDELESLLKTYREKK